MGNFREAADILEELVRAIRPDAVRQHVGLEGPGAVLLRAHLVLALADYGAFREALIWGREMVEIAAQVDQPLSLAVACYGLGYLQICESDFEAAISTLERGLSICRNRDLAGWGMSIKAALGHALASVGRLPEGQDLLSQATDAARMTGLVFDHSQYVVWLAEALLGRGNLQAARRTALEAIGLARRHKERANEAWAQFVLSEIELADEGFGPTRAKASLTEALSLATSCQMQALAAQCRQALLRLGPLSARAT